MNYNLHRAFDGLVASAVMIGMAAMLSGCNTAPRGTNTVNVAVPVECKSVEPDRPVMATDALKPGGKTFDAVVAMQAEIETREGYEGQLRSALRACIAPLKSAQSVTVQP